MPGDAGQGRRVDVVALGRAAVPAGDLAGPPPAGVGIGQPGPPRLGQFPGGFGAPVGHEGVKPGHRGLDQPDGGRRERAPGAGALLAQPGRQPQRHRADPGPGIGAEVRGADALGGQERGEVAAEVAQVTRQRGPRQQPGAQPGREVPLDRLAQPGRADPGEVQPLAFQGLVLADRDPPVVPRVPHRRSPPRLARLAGQRQRRVQPGDGGPVVVLVAGRRQPAVPVVVAAACRRHPLLHAQAGERGHAAVSRRPRRDLHPFGQHPGVHPFPGHRQRVQPVRHLLAHRHRQHGQIQPGRRPGRVGVGEPGERRGGEIDRLRLEAAGKAANSAAGLGAASGSPDADGRRLGTGHPPALGERPPSGDRPQLGVLGHPAV